MDGWRMKKYPGAQMTYYGIMTSEKFENIEPISLADHATE
jgi:gluconate 2-dehydrogenase gamma chain